MVRSLFMVLCFVQPIQQIKSIQKIKVEHDQKIMDNNLLKIEQNIE